MTLNFQVVSTLNLAKKKAVKKVLLKSLVQQKNTKIQTIKLMQTLVLLQQEREKLIQAPLVTERQTQTRVLIHQIAPKIRKQA